MDIVYHYPPELLQLLIDCIPLLCRSKQDVLLFFRGAGVPGAILSDLEMTVVRDRSSINKYEIVRRVLTRLNERGEVTLRERREVLRRVVEFEDFSTCWPNDQLKSKGLVAEIRRVVDVKDSFVRMRTERDREAAARRAIAEEKAEKKRQHRMAQDQLRIQLALAMREKNPQRRGELFEKFVNNLFRVHGVLVKESFRVTEEDGGKVLEQVDGVIELDGELYFVEVKYINRQLDVNDVSRHLVRIYHRHSARGLFVSATLMADPALQLCTEALQRTVVSLCLLEEIAELLEQYGDLAAFLRAKFRAATIEKKPFVRLRMRTSPGAA